MSSLNNSASYNSINSLTTIISNENLTQSSKQELTMILNYSLRLNEENKSLEINVLSLENVKLSSSLVQSNLDLNVYIRIELDSSKSKFLLPKLNAKTRLIKNRINPVYDETFEFNNLAKLFDVLYSDDLDTSSNIYRLVFYICNSNLFGRDQLIGQSVHNIHKDDLINNGDQYSKVIDNLTCSSHHQQIDSVDHEINPSLARIYSKKVDLVDSKVIL